MMMGPLYTCPVCCYPALDEPPVNHAICPCCGTHFAYDDANTAHAVLRRDWLDAGACWFDDYDPCPREGLSMITAYIEAAMALAQYTTLRAHPGDPYYGEIPACPGVLAIGATPDACREELQSVLESWLLVRFWQRLPIPVLDGIGLDLNPPT